jgi:hypothetical protein
MLAFESLTPQELLKEVAEYIDMEALRRSTEVKILDRKSRLTRAEKEKRARAESADNALRSIALELKGAAIIPAGSILRGSFKHRYTETYTPDAVLTSWQHESAINTAANVSRPWTDTATATTRNEGNLPAQREPKLTGNQWYLLQTYEDYRDFEPVKYRSEGFARITFNVEKHTAHGTLFNPTATLNNDEPTYSDETQPLTWEQAEEIINRTA